MLGLVLALVFALASVAHAAPKGIFTKFAQCPTGKAGVALCLYLEVSGGVFAIGKASIPIERKIVIQGGAVPTGGPNPNEYFVVPAANGATIAANELTVPGGLQAMLGCPQEGCRSPSGGRISNAVTATIELAASTTNRGIVDTAAAVNGNGPAVTLPVQVQLHNQLLGNACYLGSEAQPIELRLTDGATSPPPPNRPITGRPGIGATETEAGYEAFSVRGVTLVDNAFRCRSREGAGGHWRPSSIPRSIVHSIWNLPRAATPRS